MQKEIEKNKIIYEISKKMISLEHCAEYQDDIDVVNAAVKFIGAMQIQYASERLRSDKKFGLFIVSKNGLDLKYLSDKLKDNDEVVNLALKTSSRAIKYASDRFKDNEEIVKKLLYLNPYCIQLVSDRLKEKKEIVLIALNREASNLYHISPKLSNNKEFLFEIEHLIRHYVMVTKGSLVGPIEKMDFMKEKIQIIEMYKESEKMKKVLVNIKKAKGLKF
jgi:hypothetical protein